jgi:hypothetical protein
VALQGATVAASGTSVQSPTSDTTYQLIATWVDDSVHDATPVTVTAPTVNLQSIDASFSYEDSLVLVSVTFTVQNATAVSISGAVLLLCKKQHWHETKSSDRYKSPAANAPNVTRVDAETWSADLVFSDVSSKRAKFPVAGLDYYFKISGNDGVERWDYLGWRGQFESPMPWDSA